MLFREICKQIFYQRNTIQKRHRYFRERLVFIYRH